MKSVGVLDVGMHITCPLDVHHAQTPIALGRSCMRLSFHYKVHEKLQRVQQQAHVGQNDQDLDSAQRKDTIKETMCKILKIEGY